MSLYLLLGKSCYENVTSGAIIGRYSASGGVGIDDIGNRHFQSPRGHSWSKLDPDRQESPLPNRTLVKP